MSVLDRRSHARFALRCRAQVEFTFVGTSSRLDCVTRNVSIGGLLIESPALVPEHMSVNFSITADGRQMVPALEFTGAGEVVRVQPDPSGEGCVVAIKAARPIEYHRSDSHDRSKLVKASC
jgi:PilZ domain